MVWYGVLAHELDGIHRVHPLGQRCFVERESELKVREIDSRESVSASGYATTVDNGIGN